MQKSKRFKTGLILAALTIAPAAHAESWICEQGTLLREINVQRHTDAPAPCSVAYDKQSEGQGIQVLWNAQFDGGYCDAKADGLALKLQGLGWSCTAY